MRILLGTAGLLLASGSLPAFAQTEPPAAAAEAPAAEAPTIAVGAKILDTKGEEVGTIESVANETVVVSTGTQKATLPKAAIAQWPTGLVIAMTREELNAAASKATEDNAVSDAKSAQERDAALQVALVPGAEAHSFEGDKMLGTVKAVQGELVTFTTTSGDVALPRSAFIMASAGLSVRMTTQQFETAILQAGPKAASAPAS